MRRNLRRFAGVSAAGARSRNPERAQRAEGSPPTPALHLPIGRAASANQQLADAPDNARVTSFFLRSGTSVTCKPRPDAIE